MINFADWPKRDSSSGFTLFRTTLTVILNEVKNLSASPSIAIKTDKI